MQEKQSRTHTHTHSPHIVPQNRWHINVRSRHHDIHCRLLLSAIVVDVDDVAVLVVSPFTCNAIASKIYLFCCYRFIPVVARSIQFAPQYIYIYHWRRMLTQRKLSGIVWSIHSMTIFMKICCVSLHCVWVRFYWHFHFSFFSIVLHFHDFHLLRIKFLVGVCAARLHFFLAFEPFCLRIYVSISSMLGFVYVRFGTVYRSSNQE